VATGPTQSGKSLSAFIIPTLYHLFEIGETVICGLPDMDMASDKWREDFLPAIERTRYRDLLPEKGGGSRGGKVTAMKLRNGATLKFMSGGGGDKSRAGFTSRVLVITETDGMDESGEASREADKITQLEGRTRAYGSRRRVYMECTVSTEQGRTWREYKNGTESKLVVPCPHCKTWITMERDALLGWQNAENIVEARQKSSFYCGSCGQEITAEERKTANSHVKTLHRGQEITPSGDISGPIPPTDTLGFRWNAANNLFVSPGDIGADEWKGMRAANAENAEKELRQFVWALPHVPDRLDLAPLTVEQICKRALPIARGHVPGDCRHLTAAVDCGKYLLHWAVFAWCEGVTCHVVDYGRIEVAGDELGPERAIYLGLQQFKDACEAGWSRSTTDTWKPELCLVDAGYQTPTVYNFVRDAGKRFMPLVGRGATQQAAYHRPREVNKQTIWVGEGVHVNRVDTEHGEAQLVEANSDHWKTFLHARLTTPTTVQGALTLCAGQVNDHLSFAKHLTSEKQVEEFVAGKGAVTKWVKEHKNNHWLDASYMNCVAGQLLGVRIGGGPAETDSAGDIIPGSTRPDGRGWND
jgi:phage terminase large subunit GpA-like protein